MELTGKGGDFWIEDPLGRSGEEAVILEIYIQLVCEREADIGMASADADWRHLNSRHGFLLIALHVGLQGALALPSQVSKQGVGK